MTCGQWVLVYVAVILAFTLCFMVVYLTTGTHPPANPQTGTVFATPTPSPTVTPTPTASPTPTLVPQSGFGDHMQLGADCTVGATGFVVINPTGQFAANDPLASVTILNHDFGTTNVTMVVLHVYGDGSQTVVSSSQSVVNDPSKNELCMKFSRSGGIVNFGAKGVYKMELTTDQAILAQATFNYLG
jgi:hypothetical protein